jgi:micrococcal nuclease
MRATSIILVMLVAACQPAPTNPTAAFPQGTAATVARVVDGDSFVAEIDGRETEIRLIGVNAPEGTECHGNAARESLSSLLSSGNVTLVADGDDTDQFGRALRYAQVDGVSVNLELLARGDANVIQTDHRFNDEFVAAADSAAAAKVGMWAATACGATLPIPDIVIADVVYNPPGRDGDNRNGEWVGIANPGNAPIALGQWILRDESTLNRYRFPSGFVLAAGAEIRVRSGCGTDTGIDLYWCAPDPVWSNGGDTVILQTEDGTVAARARYSGDY